MLSQAVSQKRHPQGVKGSLFCELVANLVDPETAAIIADEFSPRFTGEKIVIPCKVASPKAHKAALWWLKNPWLPRDWN